MVQQVMPTGSILRFCKSTEQEGQPEAQAGSSLSTESGEVEMQAEIIHLDETTTMVVSAHPPKQRVDFTIQSENPKYDVTIDPETQSQSSKNVKIPVGPSTQEQPDAKGN